MPTTLMVLLVLSLLSAALWQYSVTDTTDVARDEKRMQAFYIARSGAESLAQYIIDPTTSREVKENLDKKTSDEQSLGNGSFTVSVRKSTVKDPKDPDFDSLTINAIGKVADVTVPISLKLKPTFTAILVAVGNDGNIWRSADGVTWIEISPSSGSRNLNSVVWNGRNFVAVGEHGTIRTSTNGTEWSDEFKAINNINHELNDVIWTGSSFVAVGDNSTIITSPTGLQGTWMDVSPSPSTGNKSHQAIAYNGSVFVTVGVNGLVRTSLDGNTWSAQAKAVDTVDQQLNEIIWTGSQFIVVGDNRIVLTSDTGTPDAWKDFIQASGSHLNNLTWGWGVNRFVALGENGYVRTSTNGNVWDSEYHTGVNADLNDILWTGTQFVVVGDDGAIISSPTGLPGSWTNASVSADNLNALAYGSLDVSYSWENAEWMK